MIRAERGVLPMAERTRAEPSLAEKTAATAGARVALSWIRALANAWEDDWTRAQSDQGRPDPSALNLPSRARDPEDEAG